MNQTFTIYDQEVAYEVTHRGLTIIAVKKLYFASPIVREIHFNNLPNEVQEQIIDRIKGDEDV